MIFKNTYRKISSIISIADKNIKCNQFAYCAVTHAIAYRYFTTFVELLKSFPLKLKCIVHSFKNNAKIHQISDISYSYDCVILTN